MQLAVAICIALLVCVHQYDCSLVSQSSIMMCNSGDDNEPQDEEGNRCESKLLVSMTLRSGQGDTESLYADIDQAFQEGESELSRLRRPFRIEVKKDDVIASYRVNLVGSANARPTEIAFRRDHCNDQWRAPAEDLPCGVQLDNEGERVWDSQGFCCGCVTLQQTWNIRGNFSCYGSTDITRFGSAHCMENSQLWYNVFQVGAPSLQYNITVSVLEFSGIDEEAAVEAGIKPAWKPVSRFKLNPSTTIGRSENGRVVARIQGNLAGATVRPRDLSYKYLLIPTLTHWRNNTPPVQYSNGPSDWLLLDRHLVQLSGLECNKAGVSFSGFRRHSGRCELPAHSCFTNQPLDFWEHDNELRESEQDGLYMVHNFGRLDKEMSHPDEDSFILRFLYDEIFNTKITFHIDASNLLFVYNVGKGRIVDTYATDFTALESRGEIAVEIENTGDISADYTISVLNCNRGVHTVNSRAASLDPGQVMTVTFVVQAYRSLGARYECEVQLYDSDFNLLQTANVNFRTNSTCFCYGTCGCTCNRGDDGDGTLPCPEPTRIEIDYGPLVQRAFFGLLELIGFHGFFGFFCGLLIVLGFIKLSFGKVLFCRQTKSEAFADELKKKGLLPKSGQGPMLPRCSGTCDGAHAAKAQYDKKVKRLAKLGKKPNRLDDWKNYSYECTCDHDLTDIQFFQVIKAVFFFYYCFILPFIWIGRKVVWGVFRDTADKKKAAQEAVLKNAQKKGNIRKYKFQASEEQLEAVKELWVTEKEEEKNEVMDKPMIEHQSDKPMMDHPSDESMMDHPSDESMMDKSMMETQSDKSMMDYQSDMSMMEHQSDSSEKSLKRKADDIEEQHNPKAAKKRRKSPKTTEKEAKKSARDEDSMSKSKTDKHRKKQKRKSDGKPDRVSSQKAEKVSKLAKKALKAQGRADTKEKGSKSSDEKKLRSQLAMHEHVQKQRKMREKKEKHRDESEKALTKESRRMKKEKDRGASKLSPKRRSATPKSSKSSKSKDDKRKSKSKEKSDKSSGKSKSGKSKKHESESKSKSKDSKKKGKDTKSKDRESKHDKRNDKEDEDHKDDKDDYKDDKRSDKKDDKRSDKKDRKDDKKEDRKDVKLSDKKDRKDNKRSEKEDHKDNKRSEKEDRKDDKRSDKKDRKDVKLSDKKDRKDDKKEDRKVDKQSEKEDRKDDKRSDKKDRKDDKKEDRKDDKRSDKKDRKDDHSDNKKDQSDEGSHHSKDHSDSSSDHSDSSSDHSDSSSDHSDSSSDSSDSSSSDHSDSSSSDSSGSSSDSSDSSSDHSDSSSSDKSGSSSSDHSGSSSSDSSSSSSNHSDSSSDNSSSSSDSNSSDSSSSSD